jgi:hypothetical protein
MAACSRKEGVTEVNNNISETEKSDGVVELVENIYDQQESYAEKRGRIIENNLEIRGEPNDSAEILGVLHIGQYVDIMEHKSGADNSENRWYKIKTNNDITGWIYGYQIFVVPNGEPDEFKNKKWQGSFGFLPTLENIEAGDILACSWHNFFTVLKFSEQGHYAMGDYWSGADFGSYTFENNTISFSPPLIVNRFDEYYRIDKLYYSHELYYDGSPVLTTEDETVVFSANGNKTPEPGSIVKIHQQYCEVLDEDTKIQNNILLSLPDINSKNLFQDNYYGGKANEAAVKKIARTEKNGVLWYYIFVDFTGEDASDGGGPYYFGWISEEYTE